jgi:uncharacterized protein
MILKVEKIIWDIIDLINICKTNEIFKRYGNIYSDYRIKKALNEINDFKKRYYLFRHNPIKTLKFPLSNDEINTYLTKKISHIVINITDDCNLRCGYCKFSGQYYYEYKHRPFHMKKEVLKKSIDFLVKSSSEVEKEKLTIGFYGGEPLLKFNLITYAVNYAKKCLGDNVLFSITTNGTLLNKEIAQFLIENDFILNISIDGPKVIHDRYRKNKKGKGSFDILEKNFLLLKTINPEYYSKKVGAIVVLAPPFRLLEVYNFFKNYPLIPGGVVRVSSVDQTDTNFYNQFDKRQIFKEYQNQINDLKETFKKKLILEQLDQITNFEFDFIGKALQDVHIRNMNLLGDEIFPNGICLPGFEKPLIGTDGTIHICEKMGYNFPVGNVNDGYDKTKVLDLIEKYIRISEPCKKCWAVRLCKTCFVSAKRGNSLDAKRKKQRCKKLLTYFKNSLIFYCEIMENNKKILDKVYKTI